MLCVLDSAGLEYHPMIGTCKCGNERTGFTTNWILMFRVFTPCVTIIYILEGPGTPIFGVEDENGKFNLRVGNNSRDCIASESNRAQTLQPQM
jgi:hypothetical protein